MVTAFDNTMLLFSTPVYYHTDFHSDQIHDTTKEQTKVTKNLEGNFSSQEAKDIMEIVEERLLKVEHVENLYMTTGSQWFNSGGDTMARGYMEVVDTEFRDISGNEVFIKAQEATADIPGVIVELTAE